MEIMRSFNVTQMFAGVQKVKPVMLKLTRLQLRFTWWLIYHAVRYWKSQENFLTISYKNFNSRQSFDERRHLSQKMWKCKLCPKNSHDANDQSRDQWSHNQHSPLWIWWLLRFLFNREKFVSLAGKLISMIIFHKS
jgi:hypothetical protein